WQMR
ncbi:hypothetical protein BVZ65_01041B, partial [Haemophilus influenzae]